MEPTQVVYMTKKDKRVTKEEARAIIQTIKELCDAESEWIEFKKSGWSISFIEKEAISLSSTFCFKTEFNKKVPEASIERLYNMKPKGDVVSISGKLDAFSCEISTNKYGDFVEKVFAAMNKITNNKFEVHWV